MCVPLCVSLSLPVVLSLCLLATPVLYSHAVLAVLKASVTFHAVHAANHSLTALFLHVKKSTYPNHATDQVQLDTLHTPQEGFKQPFSEQVSVLPQGKLRLDAYLTAQLPHSSRGKLQAAIKAGNVVVNGKLEVKTSLGVRAGDAIQCVLLEPPLMQALPEVATAATFVVSCGLHSTSLVHSTAQACGTAYIFIAWQTGIFAQHMILHSTKRLSRHITDM